MAQRVQVFDIAVVSRPAVTVLVHEFISGFIEAALHRHHVNGLCIAKVALKGALDFKIITFYEVCHMRVLDAPSQYVVAGKGLKRIFLLLHYKIVDAVVGRDGDGIGGLVCHYH